MTNCPYCDHDLSELINFDNIYKNFNCSNCGIVLFLNYDEQCGDEFDICYEYFYWEIKKNNNINI